MQATCVSKAACDQVGLTGFGNLLGVAESDAALASDVDTILFNTANSASVKVAVIGDAGFVTLRRIMTYANRSPSPVVFDVVDNLLDNAPAAVSQAFFDCGIVAWLRAPGAFLLSPRPLR